MKQHMQLVETIAHLFHPRRSNNHRARLLHPESIFSIAFIVMGFALALHNLGLFSKELGDILGYASDISVAQVVELTNTERSKSGLGQVQLNDTLSSAARAKAADMFAQQYWAHVSPTGKQPWDFMKEASYSFSAAGENLARDFGTTPEMVAAWMGSPSHRANIMNGTYTEIGVAVVNGNLQGIDTTLVVQMFGRPPSSAAAVTTEASQTVLEQTATRTRQAGTQIATEVPEATPAPTATPLADEPVTMNATIDKPAETPLPESEVLAQAVLPAGEVMTGKIAPQEIIKPVFLSILVLIIVTLAYDVHMFERKNTVRVAGKNIAHILFLATIAALVVIFKAGVIK